MLSTTRTLAGLEKLIAAEKEKLSGYGPHAPREEKEAINVLIAASRKLQRQLIAVATHGPHWLSASASLLAHTPKLHGSATSLHGSTTRIKES